MLGWSRKERSSEPLTPSTGFSTKFSTKERNVNDTLQRQRRSATEPRVAPSGATLGCLFQIITNPEWGCALIHGSVRRNPFRVHGGMGLLTQGRRSFLAPTLGSVTQRRWRSMQSVSLLLAFIVRGEAVRLVPESSTPNRMSFAIGS